MSDGRFKFARVVEQAEQQPESALPVLREKLHLLTRVRCRQSDDREERRVGLDVGVDSEPGSGDSQRHPRTPA